jgi:hypothetical protein
VTVRITSKQYDAFSARALRERCSVSAVVRKALALVDERRDEPQERK